MRIAHLAAGDIAASDAPAFRAAVGGDPVRIRELVRTGLARAGGLGMDGVVERYEPLHAELGVYLTDRSS